MTSRCRPSSRLTSQWYACPARSGLAATCAAPTRRWQAPLRGAAPAPTAGVSPPRRLRRPHAPPGVRPRLRCSTCFSRCEHTLNCFLLNFSALKTDRLPRQARDKRHGKKLTEKKGTMLRTEQRRRERRLHVDKLGEAEPARRADRDWPAGGHGSAALGADRV